MSRVRTRKHTRSCWYYYTTHTHTHTRERTARRVRTSNTRALLVRFNPTSDGDVVRRELVLGHERLVTALKFEVIPKVLAVVIIQTLLFAFVAFSVRFREQTYRVSGAKDAVSNQMKSNRSVIHHWTRPA